jgi:hypothetical protein
MSTYDWDGPAVGVFDDALNWSNATNGSHGVPGAQDTAIVLGTAKRPITITGPGVPPRVATLGARYLTIAVSMSAGSVDLSGNDVLDTGAGLNTGDMTIEGDFTIGGFVNTAGNVSLDAPGDSVTIGVSTGIAQSIGWTVKDYFDDFDGDVTVEHGGSYLKVSVNDAAGGMDLRSAADRLLVEDDATLTTSGLFAAYGASVVFDSFAHVYATGSNFSYGKSLFGGSFVADGLVSADFEGPTTIANAYFTGTGAIVIGYQNEEEAGVLTNKAAVRVWGSARVTDSYTLIADGALALAGSAVWAAGGGAAKNGMEGAIQVGWFTNVAKTSAGLSVEGASTLKGAALRIEPDGRFSLGADARVVLGSGAVRVGAVAVGTGGALGLDGASGSYMAATDIEGGTMGVARSGASGTATITFESQGGHLVVAKGANVGNTIAGFSNNASIDFLGLVTTSATFKNDILTLMDDSRVVETLKFATSEHLIVSSDHKGGTEITYGGNSGVTFEGPAAAAGGLDFALSASDWLNASSPAPSSFAVPSIGIDGFGGPIRA